MNKEYSTVETVFVVQCKVHAEDEKWHDCKIYKTVAAVDKALASRRFNWPGFIYRVMVRIVVSYDVCYLENGYEWEGRGEWE